MLKSLIYMQFINPIAFKMTSELTIKMTAINKKRTTNKQAEIRNTAVFFKISGSMEEQSVEQARDNRKTALNP